MSPCGRQATSPARVGCVSPSQAHSRTPNKLPEPASGASAPHSDAGRCPPARPPGGPEHHPRPQARPAASLPSDMVSSLAAGWAAPEAMESGQNLWTGLF